LYTEWNALNYNIEGETVSTVVVHNQPCISCNSSDAMQVYEEGDAHCFSCNKNFSKEQVKERVTVTAPRKSERQKLSLETVAEFPIRGFKERCITKAVNQFFGVHVTYGEDGLINAHYYPYEGAYKVRRLPKDFVWLNKSSGLFGKNKFSGGGKRLIICEGEMDALSVAQASQEKYNKIYPVVALSSSSMTKSLIAEREWIRSFKEVVICFDEDEAGWKAQAEAIKIIGVDKVKIAKLPMNDCNEMLQKGDSLKLLGCIWDAAPYIPSGIITKEALWDQLVEYNSKTSVRYPSCIDGVNMKTKGARLGEIALFVSGTSCGRKSLAHKTLPFTSAMTY